MAQCSAASDILQLLSALHMAQYSAASDILQDHMRRNSSFASAENSPRHRRRTFGSFVATILRMPVCPVAPSLVVFILVVLSRFAGPGVADGPGIDSRCCHWIFQ